MFIVYCKQACVMLRINEGVNVFTSEKYVSHNCDWVVIDIEIGIFIGLCKLRVNLGHTIKLAFF